MDKCEAHAWLQKAQALSQASNRVGKGLPGETKVVEIKAKRSLCPSLSREGGRKQSLLGSCK